MGARQSNISTTSANLPTNTTAGRRTSSQSSTTRAPHSHAHQSAGHAVGFFGAPMSVGQSNGSEPGELIGGSGRERRQSLVSFDELSAFGGGSFNRILTAQSLPVQLLPFTFNEFKCPFCSKTVLPDDADCHLVMCFTKPRISYNEDLLTDNKGECVICLEDLEKGHTIARLPCLCIYHKTCIDSWFEVNRSCPEHPSD